MLTHMYLDVSCTGSHKFMMESTQKFYVSSKDHSDGLTPKLSGGDSQFSLKVTETDTHLSASSPALADEDAVNSYSEYNWSRRESVSSNSNSDLLSN